MATKRSTFQKRQRETDLKDKARAKEARRAAKRDAGAPDQEAAAEAARAQEAEIAAAIAAAQAASNTIAHDARRAASAPTTTPGDDTATPSPDPSSDRPRR